MLVSIPRTEMFRLSLALVMAITSGALTGCDSDSLSVDELPEELERWACANAVACGGAENQTTCESTLFFAESSDVMTLLAAVKRGTVKYDGESARACLDALPTGCADVVEPDACDNVFKGTVPSGGACVTGIECVNQGRCLEPDTCSDTCCVGTCEAGAAPVAIGGACDFLLSVPCVKGAFCASDGTCTASRPAGAACQGSRDECIAPAVCLQLPDGSETCTVISSAPGAACVPGANFGCGREDEICNATTSLCTKRAAVGAACQFPDDCVGYATCDAASRTCKARPTLGQPCDDQAGVWCIGGLICSNGVCVEPAPGVACVP